ncbi:hypothetical protein BDV41DRAFT_519619 [Aspergillus transmontanensis]|nr:hypothetical protein BDV41DRAFT_519619 [Aspergillus transmontanensis]
MMSRKSYWSWAAHYYRNSADWKLGLMRPRPEQTVLTAMGLGNQGSCYRYYRCYQGFCPENQTQEALQNTATMLTMHSLPRPLSTDERRMDCQLKKWYCCT